jgi:hypothetical protein
MVRSRNLLVRCGIVAALMSAAAGCSSGQSAVPAGTPTPAAASTAAQPVPRLVVVTEAKAFVRTGQTGQGLFTLQPLPKDAKVALSVDEVWARVSGKDLYFQNGSVAYLGLYSDAASKTTKPAYVTVGGPLPIPRCQSGTPAAIPSATQSGVPVGGATLCYRIFVLDGTTGDILRMMDADIPE